MRGLEIVRLRLDLEAPPGDRRARAEALADGILSLRRAVERATLT